MVETSSIEPIEVKPVARILQEVAIGVIKNICPLGNTVTDDIWVVPHGLNHPVSQLIIGLVVNEDHITFTKGVRVNMEGQNVTSIEF